MDEVNGNTSKRPEQKGWDVSARGQEDELATDGKRRDYIYTHTHKHQLKVIRAEADDQVGGWNHTSRGGGSGKRWEVNTQNKNRDKTITWTQA